MFTINDDLSIYVTRGDKLFFTVTAQDEGKPYKFQPGDVVRIKVFGKKDAENVVLQKDFPVVTVTEKVEIYLTEQDTKIGDVISKPTDYWYEVELNPYDDPQTIIGYDEDGPKVFRLLPEGRDMTELEPDIQPEDIPIVDSELDMTSLRPIQNQAVARAFRNLEDAYERTHAAVAELLITPQMFGAIGDGVSDDTDAITAALEACGNKTTLHFPAGTYLDTANRVIETCITGAGQTKSVWKFAGTGAFLTYRGGFADAVSLKDIGLTSAGGASKANTAITVRRVSDASAAVWGGQLTAENVRIVNFATCGIRLVNTYNSQFTNCSVHCPKNTSGKQIAKGIVVEAENSFANQNSFHRCIIDYAKIAIQCVSCTTLVFKNCMIEHCQMLLNTVKATYECKVAFEDCWFEDVQYDSATAAYNNRPAIVNARIDEDTLLPLSPVSGMNPTSYHIFRNNWSVRNYAPYTDQTVNHDEEGSRYNFTLVDGFVLI